MAEESGKVQVWTVAKYVFDVLWSWESGGDLKRWLLLLVIVLVVLGIIATAVFKALGKVLEWAVKGAEFYKGSGLPVPMSVEDRQLVRQRAQFCAVLGADLAQLAKFESWNDQWFTDLEAEVESEGGYYPSALSRLLRRPSSGLRKEKSLIRAITKSTERAVQLVGEPGAGKSVALRHLATQMSRKGQRSKARKTLVPLYINLREMPSGGLSQVTADGIKAFILDNIRRGDSDTTAFVRDNWAKYRDDGVWFFLFDSFDEIPAVLHAEKGSAAASAYSQAIRQFLEGMGTCRGVLASREFKGPEALAWMKFRILPLNAERQRALVNNAILTPRHVQVVLHHLAQGGQLGATPLFLTLLCRHVKLEGRAPTNDHDLLSIHLDRLASKDFEYLERHYGLQPSQLLVGAEQIACLFAEQAALGLAPSLDQIAGLLDESTLPGGDLQNMLAALVDCKIGRADVPNALRGDRRFAFAHRRYQESLFVRYLVRHPEHLSPGKLLSDPRWREYAVTLLQAEPIHSLEPLLTEAISMLDAAPSSWVVAQPPAPAVCGYFEWQGDQTVYLLELLQEGLARRAEDVPDLLREAVARFLSPRWDAGDTKDRCEVVRLGALLPEELLTVYLTVSFSMGTSHAQAAAFKQTPAVQGSAPKALTEAVLRRLSAEILAAPDLSKLIQIEALASRLPNSWGAMYVYRRNVFLRRVLRTVRESTFFWAPYRLLASVPEMLTRKLFPSSKKRDFNDSGTPLYVLGMLCFATFAAFATATSKGHFVPATNAATNSDDAPRFVNSLGAYLSNLELMPRVGLSVSFACICAYILLLLTFSLRHTGQRLDQVFILSRLSRIDTWKVFGTVLLILAIAIIILGGVSWILGIAGYAAYLAVEGKPPPLPQASLGFVLTLVGLYSTAISAFLFVAIRGYEQRRKFQKLLTSDCSELEAISAFTEKRALPTVLGHWPKLVSASGPNRSLASWLSYSRLSTGVTAPLCAQSPNGSPSESLLKTCLEQLELRREESEPMAALRSDMENPPRLRG